MATRFWFPSSGAAAVSPTIDANWDVSTYRSGRPPNTYPTYDRLQCATTRPTSAYSSRVAPSSMSGTSQRTVLRQYVSAPMNAQTIAIGTIKGIIRAANQSFGIGSGTPYPLALYLSVRVVSRNGSTVRGTIFALQTAGTPTTAFATSLTDRKAPALWTGTGTATTAVTASQGDRFVFEIGAGQAGTPGAGPYGSAQPSFEFGTSGSDLPEDETGTTQLSPWIELSQNITWEGAGGGVIDPGTAPASVSPSTTPGTIRTGITWKVYLCDLTGQPISDITHIATNAQLTCGRNVPATFSCELPADNVAVATLHTDGIPYLHAKDRVIKAYRSEAGAFVCRFAGKIQTVAGVLEDAAKAQVLAADPLQEMAYQLCRDTSYNMGIGFSDTPTGDIVRMLIENANGYAVANSWPISGFQSDGGTIPSLAVQSPTYGVKDVLSAILELGQSDTAGFDIWAAPLDHSDSNLARLMMYAAPAGQGNARPDVVFGWHAAPWNLTQLTIVEDGAKAVNIAVATDSSSNTTVSVTSSTSLTRYGPLHAVVSGSGDQTDSTYLTGLATKAVAANPVRFFQQTTAAPGVTAEPWLAWFIGDAVTVNVGTEWFGGFTATMTIEGFTVTLDDEERLTNLVVKQ